MWRGFLAALALATTCWVCSAIADQADVEIGLLTCTLAESGETSASATPSQEGARDALCTFIEKSGAEETYIARAQGVSISADQKAALIWLVRSTSGAELEPGALQQIFATDSKTQADQKPPLIGERNAEISLHSMSDRVEGSTSATEKLAPVGFVILSLELKLRSASG